MMKEFEDLYNIISENIKQCQNFIENKIKNEKETFLETNQLVNSVLQTPSLYKDKEEARKRQLNKIPGETKEELKDRINYQNNQVVMEENIAKTLDTLLSRGL